MSSIPITIPNTPPAARVGTALQSSKLAIQVFSPAGVMVRLGKSRDELDNPLPFGRPAGYQFDSTSGIIELQWQGEVWLEGLPTNASLPIVSVEVTSL
jgi:hypothetical protein